MSRYFPNGAVEELLIEIAGYLDCRQYEKWNHIDRSQHDVGGDVLLESFTIATCGPW